MMGRGLVEPVDDLRATNPASHPELLQRLADDFVEHGYDVRHTLRVIAGSAAYQRAAAPVQELATSQHYFQHALTRPLSPEVLVDAVADVTGISERYGAEPSRQALAIELYDARVGSRALEILGRCPGDEICAGGIAPVNEMTRQLHWLNGDVVNQKLEHPEGRLAKLLASGVELDTIVDQFYRRALARPPHENELLYWRQQLSAEERETRQQRCADFVWSLLTCREFATNH